MKDTLIPGATYHVPYPFVRDTYEAWDYDEAQVSTTVPCWKPGVRATGTQNTYGDAYAFEADGEGTQVLTLISRHHPGKPYRERVFYTQSWVDPHGKAFGKGTLRMTTLQRFAGMTHGYHHAFALTQEATQ